jgi:hypothetical protein
MLVTLIFAISACSNSITDAEEESQVESKIVKDLPANAGTERGAPHDFTYYNLEEGAIVAKEDSASTSWDLAFSKTTILINNGDSGPGQGGAIVLDVPFDEVSIAPSEGYRIDQNGAYAVNGWYNYTGRDGTPPHAVIPFENKTIVLKTGDGEYYAKMRILSYYKGNPDTSTEKFANVRTRAASSYYTFEYAIQLNGSRELK